MKLVTGTIFRRILAIGKTVPVTIFVTIFLFTVNACSRPAPPLESPELNEALQKLNTIATGEMKVDIISKVIDNTLWIYLPMEESIIETKASGDGVVTSKDSNISQAVNYLSAQFVENDFVIEYDIGMAETYSKDFGYSNNYSEAYQLLQQGLLSAIHRSFHNVKGSPVEFVIFIIADIKNGIETENTLNLTDLIRAHSLAQELPQDEFTRRFLSELRGTKRAINDAAGKHLRPHAISWPVFLAKQMENRINFKYQRSMFPPSGDAQKEITGQVKETLRVYEFSDYDEIILKDLRTGTQKRLK